MVAAKKRQELRFIKACESLLTKPLSNVDNVAQEDDAGTKTTMMRSTFTTRNSDLISEFNLGAFMPFRLDRDEHMRRLGDALQRTKQPVTKLVLALEDLMLPPALSSSANPASLSTSLSPSSPWSSFMMKRRAGDERRPGFASLAKFIRTSPTLRQVQLWKFDGFASNAAGGHSHDDGDSAMVRRLFTAVKENQHDSIKILEMCLATSSVEPLVDLLRASPSSTRRPRLTNGKGRSNKSNGSGGIEELTICHCRCCVADDQYCMQIADAYGSNSSVKSLRIKGFFNGGTNSTLVKKMLQKELSRTTLKASKKTRRPKMVESWSSASESSASTPLRILDVSGMVLSDGDMVALVQLLKHPKCALETLQFLASKLKVESTGTESIFTSLSKSSEADLLSADVHDDIDMMNDDNDDDDDDILRAILRNRSLRNISVTGHISDPDIMAMIPFCELRNRHMAVTSSEGLVMSTMPTKKNKKKEARGGSFIGGEVRRSFSGDLRASYSSDIRGSYSGELSDSFSSLGGNEQQQQAAASSYPPSISLWPQLVVNSFKKPNVGPSAIYYALRERPQLLFATM